MKDSQPGDPIDFSDDSKFDFYYVTFVFLENKVHISGATMIRQHKLPCGEPNPDGFSPAEATRYLSGCYSRLVIVQEWRQVSPKRFHEWQDFVMMAFNPSAKPSDKPKHLTLVPHLNEEKEI